MAAAPDSLTISSRLESIDEGRRWVTERATAAGIGADELGEIELALTEALANVIEHAYEGDPSREILLEVEAGDREVAIHVRDWGRPGDPASFRSRDLDDPGDGGYGVYLMNELMDDVTREPQPEGGTLLTLIKRRKEGHDG